MQCGASLGKILCRFSVLLSCILDIIPDYWSSLLSCILDIKDSVVLTTVGL